MGGQGMGHGPGTRRGWHPGGRGRQPGAGRLRAVHRRRYRLPGSHAARSGGRGGGGRPGSGLADGAAADGHRVGARCGPGLRVLLRPALSVPAGERARLADGGGCMLVRRGALEKSGGLAPISGALIDDVAMGRMIKRQRGRCWLGLSRQVVSIRPYPGLASLWQMVARSAYTQLNYSPALLAATILGLMFLYVLPPVGAVIGLAVLLAGGAATGPAALAAGAGLAGWALMSLTYLPMLRLYRLSPLRAPSLPLIALLYAGMTADSARRHHTGRGAEWRGRTNQELAAAGG